MEVYFRIKFVIRWAFEPPGQMEGVPAQGRELELDDL